MPKSCPLARGGGYRDRCLEEDCAWWDQSGFSEDKCIVMRLAEVIEKIYMAIPED